MTANINQAKTVVGDITKVSKQPNRNLIAAISLGLIILFGAYLRIYKLGAYSIGNTYYAAAVQSMLTSWKNFFFVAFEPGGSVTVDKPPLGFWVQAVSAYLFGVNGFALALPQALAGLLSIPLLYILVKRYFGIFAGLIAALVLSVIPVTVATERNNTIDGLLVFVLLLAAWAFIKATESGKFHFLLLGAFIVGLGFNIKMLQAFMPLPAFFGIYFLGVKQSWWKKILHLLMATIVLLVVSLSWAVIVDLVPADERPFIGSSTNNTVMELIIGHNGLSRLGLNQRTPNRDALQAGDNVQNPQSLSADAQDFLPPTQRNVPPIPLQQNNKQQMNNLPPLQNSNQPRQKLPLNQPNPDNPQNNNWGNGRSEETGEAGVLRLFTEPLVTEMSWLLPFALLGSIAAVFAVKLTWPMSDKHLGILLWVGWLLPSMVYFCFTTGLFHRYYLIMLGPPLAALVGISVWAILQYIQRNRFLGWGLAFTITAATIGFEFYTISSYPDYAGMVTAVTTILWLLGIGLLLIGSSNLRLRNMAMVVIVLSMLVSPFTWSLLTTLNSNPNVALPTAGASDDQRSSRNTPDFTMDARTETILEFLLENINPEYYLLATQNARNAAPYILATSRPVLTFGGFMGSDDIIDLNEFVDMVENGEIQYVLGIPTQKPEIAQWMRQTCSVINPNTGEIIPGFTQRPTNNQGNSQNGRVELYDCGIS
ncbi:MAG: glycosyltransferase family 39 protein [Anaerolineales bacterium]